MPPDLLTGLGIFLLAYGAAVGYLAARPVPPSGWVRAVVLANLAWAAASVCALLFGWLEPSPAGMVWIPLQGAVVAGFAALQASGLNRRERG